MPESGRGRPGCRAIFTHRIDDDTELRLVQMQDAPALRALTDDNREHLRRWLPWVEGSKTLDDTRDFIKSSLSRFADNNGFVAGIWFQGSLAGTIDFHSIDWTNRRTSIGYLLSASFQGRGLMTKACRAMMDHAFHDLHLNRVEIRCAPDNTRSRAIPERLGFTQEGTIRQAAWTYDRYVDDVVYGMLAAEWRNR